LKSYHRSMFSAVGEYDRDNRCVSSCVRGRVKARRDWRWGAAGRDDQWMTLQMSAVSDAAAHGHGPRGAEGARDGSRDTCEPIMSNAALQMRGIKGGKTEAKRVSSERKNKFSTDARSDVVVKSLIIMCASGGCATSLSQCTKMATAKGPGVCKRHPGRPVQGLYRCDRNESHLGRERERNGDGMGVVERNGAPQPC
jgi:hypothetical protein